MKNIDAIVKSLKIDLDNHKQEVTNGSIKDANRCVEICQELQSLVLNCEDWSYYENEINKIWQILADAGEPHGLYMLGCQYSKIYEKEKAIDLMMRAADKNHELAIRWLIIQYKMDNNKEKALHYYNLGVQNGCKYIISRLAYEYVEGNFYGEPYALNKAAYYHYIAGDLTSSYSCLKKVVKRNYPIDEMTIELIRTFPFDNEQIKNPSHILVSYQKLLNENIDIMNLHFDYTVKGKGYEEAKSDFIKKLTT